MRRHLPVLFSVVVGIGMSGCGSSTRPTSPTAPPAAVVPPAPAPQLTYTLSGVVSEVTAAGNVAAEGVELYCDSCGSPDGHTFTSSDANGFYSFAWARNGVHPLLVWKAGFVVVGPSGAVSEGGAVNATVDGDTRLDIKIARR
jgi:hypothetical protein